MLLQDNVGGLEVLNANAHWIPAPPIPGAFVINVGDFLMRLTNRRFLSTVHRVTNKSGKERYSMPWFCSFNLDAIVEVCFSPHPSNVLEEQLTWVQVLPNYVTEEQVAAYEPITVAEVSLPILVLQNTKCLTATVLQAPSHTTEEGRDSKEEI
jgi:hypothetical protein